MPNDPSPLTRIGLALRLKPWAIGLEILFGLLLIALPALLGWGSGMLLLFLFANLSLWVRGVHWEELGLHRPAHWGRALALAASGGLGYQAITLTAVTPLLLRLTGESLDPVSMSSLQGGPVNLIISLLITWGWTVPLEEMAFRGYFAGRVSDLLEGRKGRVAAALALTALVYGLSHLAQGWTAAVDTALFGLVLGGVYLAAGRNLWAAMIAHALGSALAFGLIYSGLTF